jgi:glycosyltransferase involved in cell wall biosynthesis
MKSIKVFFITPDIYPNKIGGAEIFDYYLLREIKNNKFEFGLITHNSIDAENLKQICYEKPRLSIFRAFFLFLEVIKNHKKINLLHISFMHSSWYNWFIILLLKKSFNIPYTITIHGGKPRWWKLNWLYNKFFRNASAIIGVSEKIKKEYESYLNLPVYLIPSDIPLKKDSSFFEKYASKLNLQENTKLFLSVGSIKKIKNPFCILKAINHLGVEFLEKNRIKFVFAGNGNLFNDCIEFVNSKGLNNYVYFIGNVKREELPSLYNISYAYIIASEYESNSISTLEAVYNKVPIIASKVRALNSIYKSDEVLFFDYDNSRELSDLIKKILNNKQNLELMTIKAFERHKSRFDYQRNVVNPYIKIFTSILMKNKE